MDHDVPRYCYQPIDAHTEIRVLQLEPGLFSDPLVGNIVLCKTETNSDACSPEYDCVSYCWGPNENFTSLRCDGQAMPITAVVDEMLRHLRQPTESRNLWVDAICINQVNHAEKSVQVCRMSNIYQAATTVHVWLGPATNEDRIDDIFAVLKQGTANERGLGYAHDQNELWISLLQMSHAVEALLRRSYFTRRWVLQEVASGRVVVVHCGDCSIYWESFCHVAQRGPHNTRRREFEANVSRDTMMIIYNIAALNSTRDHHQHWSDRLPQANVDDDELIGYFFDHLLDILYFFDSTHCTDARDRLYSLYGLLPPRLSSQLERTELDSFPPIDYKLDWETIYTRFASAAVFFGQSQKLLLHVLALGSLGQQDAHSPSWVPSWNKGNGGFGLAPMLQAVHPDLVLVQKRITNTATDIPRAPRGTLQHWSKARNAEAHLPSSAAISYRGQVSRVMDVQADGEYADAISYFKSMVDCESIANEAALTGLVAARVLAFAISNSECFDARNVFDVYRAFPSKPKNEYTDEEKQGLISKALEKEMGLPSPQEADEGFVVDSTAFRNEVARVIPPNAFYYKVAEKPGFGVSQAPVQPGDYVFRTVEAAAESTVLALVLRPCELTDTEVPARFRLVGAGIDYCYTGHSTNPQGEYMDITIY